MSEHLWHPGMGSLANEQGSFSRESEEPLNYASEKWNATGLNKQRQGFIRVQAMNTPEQKARAADRVIWTLVATWLACFLLLFLFIFNADFYVIVGTGPGAWKKPTPLSFPERFFLSVIFATALEMAGALAYGCFVWFRKLICRGETCHGLDPS